MRFSKSLLAAAVAAASLHVSAADVPVSEWVNGIPPDTYSVMVGTDLTYTGTGSEELVMTQDPSVNVGESPMVVANGHELKIENIKSLTIIGTGVEGKWNSGIYTNTQKSSAITVSVSDSISVEGTTFAVHALDGTIKLEANDISLKGGNAIVAQVNGEVSLKAANKLSIEATSTAVFSQSFGTPGEAHAVSLSAKDLKITSSGGSAVASDYIGNISIDVETADLTGTTGIRTSGGSIMLKGDDIEVTGTNGVAISITEHAETSKAGTLTLNTQKLTANGTLDASEGKVTVENQNAVIVSTGDASAVSIGELDGENLTIELDHIIQTPDTQTVSIGTNKLARTDVRFSASAVDNYSAEEAAEVMKEAVDLGTVDGTADGAAAAGTLTGYGTNFTTTVDAATGAATTTGSDITKSTMDMAAMTLVAWRNEVTTLNDRMSTLRSSSNTAGVWARWNGGKYKYDDRNLSNTFNTIEIGADRQIEGTPWIIGASLSYTKGDGDFQQGDTDSDAYSGALYAMWSHEKGSFVDMVMKTGRISTDYDFYNRHGGAVDSAKLDQTGFIVGVETGHRFALTDMFFVEPQLQLTYSRLSGVHETTSLRTVDLKASDSLIGRIGAMAGISCPNDMGQAYIRISALRDFRGDIDGTFMSNGNPYAVNMELDQNWVEFALGANFKLTDNFYTFVDVQKSTGGDIELDWRANIGAKYLF